MEPHSGDGSDSGGRTGRGPEAVWKLLGRHGAGLGS